jgi:hypothetical protein
MDRAIASNHEDLINSSTRQPPEFQFTEPKPGGTIEKRGKPLEILENSYRCRILLSVLLKRTYVTQDHSVRDREVAGSNPVAPIFGRNAAKNRAGDRRN